MEIIDSHIHFWDISNGYNDWVESTDLPRLVTPDDFDVNKFVHIEAHSEIYSPICEYEWLKSKFENKDIKVVAFLDFTKNIGEFEIDVSNLIKYKDVVGVRQIMSKTYKSKYSPFDKIIPSDLQQKLEILNENNLMFEAQMYPEQFLPILDKINNSGVKMVIEHFGLPIFGRNNNLSEWHSFVKEVSMSQNFHIKLSGFDINNATSYLSKALGFIFENVSSSKLCYGSNYPVSYQESYNLWHDYLKSYINDNAICDNVFSNTAEDIYFRNNGRRLGDENSCC